MELLAAYGLFLAKFITILLIPVVALVLILKGRNNEDGTGPLKVKNLSRQHEKLQQSLKSKIWPAWRFEQWQKDQEKSQSSDEKSQKKTFKNL